MSRRDESAADIYAVEKGHGYALRSALIRNFGVNQDNLYYTSLDTALSMSQPTIIKRLTDISLALLEKEKKHDESAPVKAFQGGQQNSNNKF